MVGPSTIKASLLKKLELFEERDMNARANLNWISLYVLYKLEIVGSFKDSRLNECWVKIFKSLYNIHRRHRKLSLSSWFSLSFQRNRGPSFQAKRINNFLFDPKRTLDPKLFVFDRGAPSSFVCIEIDEKIDWTDYSDTLAPSKKRHKGLPCGVCCYIFAFIVDVIFPSGRTREMDGWRYARVACTRQKRQEL